MCFYIVSEKTDKISLLKITNPTAKNKKSGEIIAISNYLSTNFNRIFEITVKAINPSNPSVFQIREVSLLRDVFIFKRISAERGLDELDNHPQLHLNNQYQTE